MLHYEGKLGEYKALKLHLMDSHCITIRFSGAPSSKWGGRLTNSGKVRCKPVAARPQCWWPLPPLGIYLRIKVNLFVISYQKNYYEHTLSSAFICLYVCLYINLLCTCPRLLPAPTYAETLLGPPSMPVRCDKRKEWVPISMNCIPKHLQKHKLLKYS